MATQPNNPTKASPNAAGSPSAQRDPKPPPKPPQPSKVEGNPPKPGSRGVELSEERYAQLTPADRVAYHQAKLAYAQAYAQYEAAALAAQTTLQKPFWNFQVASANYKKALGAVKDAIGRAREQLDQLGALAAKEKAGSLDPDELAEPEKAKAHLEKLQAAVDAYKRAADGVATAVAARDEAEAALRPLADPDNLDEPNKGAQDLAREQHDLEMAQAQVYLEAAFDTYMVKRAEIKGHLPH